MVGDRTRLRKKIWGGGGVGGGRGLDDRLSAECGGGDFGGDRGARLGGAFVAAAHVGALPGGAGYIDGGESSRNQGGGDGVCSTHIFFCGDTGDRDCGGILQGDCCRRAPGGSGFFGAGDGGAFSGDGDGGGVDSGEGVCFGMHGVDGGG